MDRYTPSGRGPELISVFVVFMVLSTVITALRVYVRTSMVKCFGWDDWLSITGWLLFTLHGGFAIAGAFHGTGQHVNLIHPQSEIPVALKWWWVCEPLYVISNMAIKLSIALMLLRFTLEKVHRYIVYAITGVLELYSLAFFFIFVFQCTPPSFFWTRMQNATAGQCMNPNTVITSVYVYSAITCVTDWTMALLPWFLVKDLQMSRRTKIMVAFVLGLGSIASMATIVRIPYIRSMSDTADFLYSTTDVAIWSCVETGLSIIASSAATLKPLFKNVITKTRTLVNRTSTRPGESDGDSYLVAKHSRKGYARSQSPITVAENGQARGQIVKKHEVSLEVYDASSMEDVRSV